MTVECFLDTNVLLYAASKNPAHHSKKTIAIKLIAEEQFGLSAQVLQEFYVNATRKTDFDMPPAKALEWIENLEEFACVPTDVDLVKAAVALSARYRISYWDAAILAAAEALGATTVYSEDLSHGQAYGSVTVENPFLPAPRATGFHDTEQSLLLKD